MCTDRSHHLPRAGQLTTVLHPQSKQNLCQPEIGLSALTPQARASPRAKMLMPPLLVLFSLSDYCKCAASSAVGGWCNKLGRGQLLPRSGESVGWHTPERGQSERAHLQELPAQVLPSPWPAPRSRAESAFLVASVGMCSGGTGCGGLSISLGAGGQEPSSGGGRGPALPLF